MAVSSKVEGEAGLDSWANATAHSCQDRQSYPFHPAGPPAPLLTQSYDWTASKYSLLFLLGMLFRRCQNEEKGTGSYDQEKDQSFKLTKEVTLAWFSSPCLAMSHMTEERCVCICGGREQAPTFHCCNHLQHFVLNLLLVNKVQKVKHIELHKHRNAL